MAQNSKGAYLNVLQDADGKDVYPITRADGVYMNDGTTAQAKCEALDTKIDSTKSTLEQNFQAGVDGIYNAITAQGTTPASKSQGDMQSAIKTLADAKYAAGHKGSAVASDVLAGKTFSNDSSVGIGGSRVDLGSEPEMQGGTLYNGNVYLYPVSGGDNRNYGIQRGVHASPSNIAGWSGGTLFTRSQYDSNYSSGYNQGVTDADNRVNANSTNYKSGYNAGAAAQSPIYIPALRWYMSGATQFIFNIGSPRRTYFYIGRVDNSLGLGATSGWEYLHIYLDDTTVLNALDYQGKQINISGYSTLRIEAKTTTQISNAAIVDIRIT